MTIYTKLIKLSGDEKKYKMEFYKKEDGKFKRFKSTKFGASSMSDFTKHKNEERKKRYIERHRANERWDDPYSAGALSRYILWNKTTIEASYISYKNKFKFKKL